MMLILVSYTVVLVMIVRGGPFTPPPPPPTHTLSSVRMLAHREDIDLERELHRTYKMFLEGQAALMSHKGQPLCVCACPCSGRVVPWLIPTH